MKNLSHVMDALPGLDQAVSGAADWLAKHAIIKTQELEDVSNRVGHRHENWQGAFRGEYTFTERVWWMFCPMWHGSQAIKALLGAAEAIKQDPAWLAAASSAGEFILRNQVRTGADAGLLLAYEDYPDKVTISALLETLDGLFHLSERTGDSRFSDAAVAALQWCREHAWLQGEGLVQDLYDPGARKFIHDAYPTVEYRRGRPLVDDSVWLTGYQLSSDETLRTVFYEILERLLQDESPAGNWVSYGPCLIRSGRIHPRHAFWWGRPMLSAWHETHEQRWLDAAIRAGDWYREAQRIDGGLFRDTDLSFNTRSFGQATSGIVCAAILWMDLFDATGDPKWLKPIQLAFEFAMRMQLKKVSDPRLQGAVIEGSNEPDGTDRCPYFIRDLASIFFVQAGSKLMQRCAQSSAV
jgi:hypothetical protein